MTAQVLRVSLSIPKKIVSEVDELAGIRKLTRSKIISECLRDMVAREKKALLIEGYKAMAKEHTEFAELSSRAAREVLPPW